MESQIFSGGQYSSCGMSSFGKIFSHVIIVVNINKDVISGTNSIKMSIFSIFVPILELAAGIEPAPERWQRTTQTTTPRQHVSIYGASSEFRTWFSPL